MLNLKLRLYGIFIIAFTLTELSSASVIKVNNWCPFKVYIYQSNGGHCDQGPKKTCGGAPFVIPAGNGKSSVTSLNWIKNGQGTSVKVFKDLKNYPKGGALQFEYAFTDWLYWDVSHLDGGGPSIVNTPFKGQNVKYTPTGNTKLGNNCHQIKCPANKTCKEVYLNPDDPKTRTCSTNIGDFWIDLCQPKSSFNSRREVESIDGAQHVAKAQYVAKAEDPEAVSATEDDSSSILADISKTLTAGDAKKLKALGFSATGINSVSKAGGVWIGNNGDYTNEFTNNSGEHLILVIWGPAASWVNVKRPLITISLGPNQQTIISFVKGSIGAWSAIYSNTKLVNGQISNTWGEYTFTPSGVVDVSRLVNMKGHNMKIAGPTCTSNMNTCVFQCVSGNVCTTGYKLVNCANGSQKGATSGFDHGAPSGGCGWNGRSKVALKTKLA